MRYAFTINLGKIIASLAFFYVAYCILLNDTYLHASVASLISRSHQLSMSQHLFVMGMIPIYIAIVIFGAASLGIYFGNILQRLVIIPLQNKLLLAFKTK